MPTSWEIRERILIVTVEGEWGSHGPASAIAEALADPLFQPGASLLLDVRLSAANPTEEEIRSRSRWLSSLRGQGLAPRCAIVVGSKSYQYGLARMAAVHLGFQGLALEIFTDPDEAFRWLSTAATKPPKAASP